MMMSDLIGETVVADFDDDGFFGGKIDNFDREKGHHVTYEDGDGECMDQDNPGELSMQMHANNVNTNDIHFCYIPKIKEAANIVIVKKSRKSKNKRTHVKTTGQKKVPTVIMASSGRTISRQTDTLNRVCVCVSCCCIVL